MPRDRHGRPLRHLRLSVTDHCNLRCRYCMPAEDYVWLPREDILRFEEIERLARIFLSLGVDRIRLTGGEPLLRRELEGLIQRLAALPGLRDLALTTNGVLLAGRARALRQAGLQRLTVSLDTLRPERFHALTQRDGLDGVLAGIEAARLAGFQPLKLDTVLIRGFNDDEIGPLLAWARDGGMELRFIEYMDVGGARDWRPERVVPRTEILERVRALHGEPEPLPGRGSAPAQRYRLPGGQVFGIVASTTTPFCGDCDRVRLTADGHLLTCLYAREGLDLRTPLRRGASDGEIAAILRGVWETREDRGAERRLEERKQAPAAWSLEELEGNPHLEMHTRGG